MPLSRLRFLQDQLSLFVHFEEGVPLPSSPMIGMAVQTEESDANPLNRYLLKKVDELELSVRSANCLKNDNMAGRLGVPQSFVSKYETGERRLDACACWGEVQAICRVLGLSLVEFAVALGEREGGSDGQAGGVPG